MGSLVLAFIQKVVVTVAGLFIIKYKFADFVVDAAVPASHEGLHFIRLGDRLLSLAGLFGIVAIIELEIVTAAEVIQIEIRSEIEHTLLLEVETNFCEELGGGYIVAGDLDFILLHGAYLSFKIFNVILNDIYIIRHLE